MNIRREWTTPVTAGAFLLTAATGVLMFFHWDTGLNKAAHEWLSWALLAGAGLHVAANFSAFRKYFVQRKGLMLMGGFVGLLALSFIPFGGKKHEPPFVQPIKALAHAPLTALAQVAGTSPEQMVQRLAKAGIAAQSVQQSVSDLVGDDFKAQAHALKKVLGNAQ